MSFERRFGGIAALYGRAGLDRLRQAHVAVIGVGGVGSWVVEALARSALGQITLVDLDHVAESNINRQLAAFNQTPNTATTIPGVRLWVITFMVERETTQPAC